VELKDAYSSLVHSIQSESLFVPDDDRRWDPQNLEDEEEDEMLLWDTGEEKNTITMNSGGPYDGGQTQSQSINGHTVRDDLNYRTIPTQRLAPTQRVSDVHGIFDD